MYILIRSAVGSACCALGCVLIMLICIQTGEARGPYFDYSVEGEMVFHTAGTGGNCSHCSWIAAEGTITRDTPSKFREFLKKNASAHGRIVYLNSRGGNLMAGVRLGEIIRDSKLSTAVAKTVGHLYDRSNHIGFAYANGEKPSAECLSACVFAFMGGTTRYATSAHYTNDTLFLGSAGRIGVHQFYDAAAMTDMEKKQFSARDRSLDQVVTGILLEYATRMGVSAKLLSAASQTPPSQMRFLSDGELREFALENAERIQKEIIHAVGGGQAVLEVLFSHPNEQYSVMLMCASKAQMLMRVTIKHDYDIDEKVINDWGLYDEVSLIDRSRNIKLRKQSQKVLAKSVLQLDFEIASPADSLIHLTNFEFSASSSRHGSIAAEKLSFVLTGQPHALALLVRTCP